MDDHSCCFVLVPNVVLPQFVDVLFVEGGHDGLDRHGVDDRLEMVLRPAEFLILLKLDQVTIFGVVFDIGVDQVWLGEPRAI